VDFQSVLGPPVLAQDSRSNGYHCAIEARLEVTKWVQIDLGQTAPIDEVWLLPAHPTDYADRVGFGFPPRFRVEIAADPEFSRPTLLLDHTATDFQTRATIRSSSKAGREGALRAYHRHPALGAKRRLHLRVGRSTGVLGGKNLALGAPVAALDSIENERWSKRFLVDGAKQPKQACRFSRVAARPRTAA